MFISYTFPLVGSRYNLHDRKLQHRCCRIPASKYEVNHRDWRNLVPFFLGGGGYEKLYFYLRNLKYRKEIYGTKLIVGNGGR